MTGLPDGAGNGIPLFAFGAVPDGALHLHLAFTNLAFRDVAIAGDGTVFVNRLVLRPLALHLLLVVDDFADRAIAGAALDATRGVTTRLAGGRAATVTAPTAIAVGLGALAAGSDCDSQP